MVRLMAHFSLDASQTAFILVVRCGWGEMN